MAKRKFVKHPVSCSSTDTIVETSTSVFSDTYSNEEYDIDWVNFFYDEYENCYRGEGEIVAVHGNSLQEAVDNAKAEASDYDRSMYDHVKFSDSIDYNEEDLEDLGELTVYWHFAD